MSATSKDVAQHYEKYPYPTYPLHAFGRWRDLSRVDLRSWGVNTPHPKLWISGCGTISPLMFGRRNPSAEILASDLSSRSLRIAKIRCRLFGIHNVRFLQQDLTESTFKECFDAIDSYGVIHHTSDPTLSLQKLAEALKPQGVLRLMLYARDVRAELEDLRGRWGKSGLSIKQIRAQIPKELFSRYRELQSRSGFADAILHPLVYTFSENGLGDLIRQVPSLKEFKRSSEGNHVLFLRKI